MNNYEKYRESIDPMLQRGEHIALNKNTKAIVSCQKLDCKDCRFSRRYNWPYDCTLNRTKWLVEEYTIPEVDWTKVQVDTPVLVSDDGITWVRRYFARVSSLGTIYVYAHGATSWSADGDSQVQYKYAELEEVSRNDNSM